VQGCVQRTGRLSWLASLALAACGARPVEAPRRAEEPPQGYLVAAPPSTPLHDPTAESPAREPGAEATPLPVAATTPGDDLEALEAAHQAAREGLGGHGFVIRRPGEEAERLRYVHCTTARVISEGSGADSMGGIARDLGLPPGGYYVALDPQGRSPGALSLAWYRHLARYHRLEHLGIARGLELYRYLGPRPPLGE